MPTYAYARLLLLLALILPLASGCTAVKVASATGGAAVSATTGAVKTTGKAAGAVARTVTPGGGEDDAEGD